MPRKPNQTPRNAPGPTSKILRIRATGVTSPSPAAIRQRRYRERLRSREMVVPVEIGEIHIDRLILTGWIHPDEAGNVNALSRAIREALADRLGKVEGYVVMCYRFRLHSFSGLRQPKTDQMRQKIRPSSRSTHLQLSEAPVVVG